MKLCFFTIWREEAETVGINMKIRNQVKAFSNLGLDSYFCVSANSCVKLYHYDQEKKVFDEIESKQFSHKADYTVDRKKIQKKLSSFFRLNECLSFMDEIQSKYKFDIIYIRRVMPFTRGIAVKIRKWANQGSKLYWEIPTWNDSVKTLSKKILQIYENHMYTKLKKDMQVVAISSGRESSEDIIFINNGVDPETIPLKQNEVHEGIHFICLATFTFLHGYDRLLNGLKEYYESYDASMDEEVHLYMVGNGRIDELKAQATRNGIAQYVHFEGVLTGETLNDCFNKMDVAIGNLGFFRTGVVSDTSIKIREYCARGIPFVTALKVNDFPDDFPYIMHVPMDESYINIRDICKFYMGLDQKQAQIDMRKYAENHLTWEKQLSKVLKDIK